MLVHMWVGGYQLVRSRKTRTQAICGRYILWIIIISLEQIITPHTHAQQGVKQLC